MDRDDVRKMFDGDLFGWMDYFWEVRYHQKEAKGREPYLPSPAEIEWRCRQLRWLEACGFCRAFIVNVMEHENPCFERVYEMVQRHGPAETYRRCRHFLVRTEYKAEVKFGDNPNNYYLELPRVEGGGGY